MKSTAPKASRAFARSLRALVPATVALLAMACSAGAGSDLDDAEPGETLGVSCEGKCDGWDSISSLWADPSQLDLGDLLSVGAGLATDTLNDALAASDWASVSLTAPKLYALASVAQNDLTLGNLDQLTAGLAANLGERELTTEVNHLRRDYLAGSSARVYGECAFRINAALGHDWTLPTGGFDGQAVLGFDAGANLEARVISPFVSEVSATGGAPLAAIKSARGFVLPRSAADLALMKPGEVVALRGAGRLGLNVGVGVPILVAQPVSYVSYSLVLSAGLRTQMSGQLDVQLVRMGGDEVVVDVGISRAQVKSARIALTDGWGVQGLLKQVVSIGGIDVDLGRLVEKALQKQLTARLSLIEARAEATDSDMRQSVARLRFGLAAATPGSAVDKALAQALRGDVRLAQALSNRGEPGVRAEFDLSRAGASSVSYAGIDIFGMSFFRQLEQSAGSAVVQTPGGIRTLLFDSLHREGGWFFSSHGYTRVGLSGLVYDSRSGSTLPTGEVNLFLQLAEGDDFMERDKLLDHLDALIVGLAGRDALTAIEGAGNELERYVVQACPNSQAFDPCRLAVLDDPQVVALREQGEAALEAKTGSLEPAQRELVAACGKLRLTAQATLEPAAQLVGPRTSVVADYRLDDGAVTSLMGRTKYEFRNALVRYLEAVLIDRGDSNAEIGEERADIPTAEAQILDAMAELFGAKADQYQRLAAVERAAVQSLGDIGPRMLEVRFPVAADGRADYENATAQSLAQARAKALTELYDGLHDLAHGLDPHAEQSVSYALLALTPADKIDLRVNVDMDLDDHAGQSFEHYREAGYAGFDLYAKSSSVAPIDGGLFDVNALLEVK